MMDKSLSTLNRLSLLYKPPVTNPLYTFTLSPVDQNRFSLSKSYNLRNSYGIGALSLMAEFKVGVFMKENPLW